MNNEDNVKWTFWVISDADEPGDAVYTGMRHRDFDGVTLVLWPDDEGGWLFTDALDQPTRPLLLFFHGGNAEVKDALASLKKSGLDSLCGSSVPFPATFENYGNSAEATRTVAVHLNYPPYHWLDEAKLGMEMGRYFDSVELVMWTEPTNEQPGVYTYHFFRSDGYRTRNH